MRDEFSEDFDIVTRLAGEFAPTDAASRAQAERYEKFRHIPVGPQEFCRERVSADHERRSRIAARMMQLIEERTKGIEHALRRRAKVKQRIAASHGPNARRLNICNRTRTGNHDPEASSKRPHQPETAPRDSAERRIRQGSCLAVGVNPKTIAKWKRRRTTSDARMGPKKPVSTVLSAAEEALIVVFRKRTRFSLDACLLA